MKSIGVAEAPCTLWHEALPLLEYPKELEGGIWNWQKRKRKTHHRWSQALTCMKLIGTAEALCPLRLPDLLLLEASPDDKDGEELTGDEENDAPSTRSSASWRSGLKGQSGNVETSIDDATVLLELGDHFYGPDDGFGDANSDSDHSAQGGQAWETKNVKSTVSKILEALHCGQDPTYLTPISPFDRALDLWKDHERLEKACTPLMAKTKDPHVDVLLQTCLTGMLGVLNLYLDPALQYTLREASLIIARI